MVATPDGKLYLACSGVKQGRYCRNTSLVHGILPVAARTKRVHQKRSLTPVLPELSVVMSHWPQPKLSRTSPTQRPGSGPDPRENSGVEIHHTVPPSPMTVWHRIHGGQAAGRKTDSTQ